MRSLYPLVSAVFGWMSVSQFRKKGCLVSTVSQCVLHRAKAKAEQEKGEAVR